jgi:hypothetical protein
MGATRLYYTQKAQAEFALILGLLLIAIVVAIFAYSSIVPPPVGPSALTEEQKAVDSYVKDAITRASDRTIDAIYDQGGYVDVSGKKSVRYAGNTIPYWQLCDTAIVPDVEANLESGISNLLKSSLPDQTDIAGRRVVFDKSLISVDAQLFENSMTVSVNVPTTLEGRAMPQPFVIAKQSNLGRIYDFSRNFADFQAKYRALEYNLVRLIRRSNPKSCWLPTKGVKFMSSFHKSWGELRDCMQQVIFHNLAHTYEWEKPVLKDGKLTESMMGKSWLFEVVKTDESWGQLKELDVNLYYGGEDRLLTRNDPELLFGTNPDPVEERGETFPLLGSAIGPVLVYDVKYDVAYPVVVSVWDPFLEQSFKFTTFVNMRSSQKSDDCEFGAVDPSQHHQKCVLGATEDMRLTVLDHNDAPLQGVDVWYEGCGPWRIFGDELQAKIPHAVDGELSLLHQFSGSEYTVCMDSDELATKTVKLPIRNVFDLRFYIVEIDKSPYTIKSVRRPVAENITAIFTRPGNTCMNSSQTISTNYGMWGGYEESGWVNLYQTEQYDVLTHTGKGQIEMGDLVLGGGEAYLNVYAPSVNGFTASDTQSIEDLYANCGMNPITVESYDHKVGCSLP